MNGMPHKAAKFAYDLRRELFVEHLGVSVSSPLLVDPISSATWKDLWLATAAKNTTLYVRKRIHFTMLL